MADRLALLVTSPRLPAGLLTADAWDLVRTAPVFTAADSPLADAVRAAGATVTVIPPPGADAPAPSGPGADAPAPSGPGTDEPAPPGPGADAPAPPGPGTDEPAPPASSADAPAPPGPRAGPSEATPAPPPRAEAARVFREAARGGTAVWLTGADGDPGFAAALGDVVSADGGAEIEIVYGSWDPPGARLLDVVAVMDRLRSPGGCPWDAEQTHTSLMPYLLEEAYEAYDALADGDSDALREELGDVLLQVAFHARLAEDDPDEPWSVDDVAGELVAKLVRRHPHVFAGHEVSGVEELHANWDRIKREEKSRTSALDGVAQSQPALSLVAKYLSRVAREQVPVEAPALPAGVQVPADDHALGEFLFALVAAARGQGLDAEAALRRAAHHYAERVRAAESGRKPL